MLVGICDSNPGRLEVAQNDSKKHGAAVPPAYAPADFDQMIKETKPDFVIVAAGFDASRLHRAGDGGGLRRHHGKAYDDAAQCQSIVDAKRNGRHLRVMFNYRYSPPRTQVKDLLMSGAIGDVMSVDFHWLLNTLHGADYFRRWHSNKEFSGGLMIHKATHHFDLVNWWLGAGPRSCRPRQARVLHAGDGEAVWADRPHERCLTCPEKDKCTFYLDIGADRTSRSCTSTTRSTTAISAIAACSAPDINIEDTMNVIVKYKTGATLSIR